MHWCNAISLHRISSPPSLNALGLGHRLKSTSGTMPVGGHIFVTACMCTVVPQKPPIKVAVLAKSVSQSLALKSSTLQKSLAVTFPWLCCMRCPTGQLIKSVV